MSGRHLHELHTSLHALGIAPLKIITDKVLSYSLASIENFLISRARSIRNLWTQQKNLGLFSKVRYGQTFGFYSRNI